MMIGTHTQRCLLLVVTDRTTVTVTVAARVASGQSRCPMITDRQARPWRRDGRRLWWLHHQPQLVTDSLTCISSHSRVTVPGVTGAVGLAPPPPPPPPPPPCGGPPRRQIRVRDARFISLHKLSMTSLHRPSMTRACLHRPAVSSCHESVLDSPAELAGLEAVQFLSNACKRQ